jgi:AraC-like DNA-binding protein
MRYFNDLQFIGGGYYPQCVHPLVDSRFPEFYSIQFDREGLISFGINHRKPVILKCPVIYLLHPDNTYQYGFVGEKGQSWGHSWVGFKGKRGRDIFENGFMQLTETGYLPITRSIEFASEFDKMLTAAFSGTPSEHVRAVISLEELLAILIKSSQNSQAEQFQYRKIFELAEKIKLNPVEIDFRQEAKRAGLSLSHFRRLFKEAIGLPPHDFLLKTRMRKAAKMLESNHYTVKEVASECGYFDLAFFSKLFKKKIGLSPRQYLASLFPG